MIHLLHGDDSWEREQALATLAREFPGEIERYDGETVTAAMLPDLLMATTLFAPERFIVIRNIADNTAIWSLLPDWLSRISDAITVIFVEDKPDKRTAAYKELKKIATTQEFAAWTDRDNRAAESWLSTQARQAGVNLDSKRVALVVERVGPDKWALLQALEKLSLVDAVNDVSIKELIDARPLVNVFGFFDKALRGDRQALHEDLENLRLNEDPYRLFALLSSQALQLAAVTVADANDNPSGDFSIPPFVVTRLKTASRRLGRRDIARIVDAFARADGDMKNSRGEPWLLIERSLVAMTAGGAA